MTKARLAVDIGGTFTDVVVERADGARVTSKVLTTHGDPGEGVLDGAARALGDADLQPQDITVIIHGTTLATNALIERRGAVTALLTTEGHRDSLEMAYENRFEQYDINIDRPKPLVPRWLRLPVRERMNKDGRALIPLENASVEACLPILDREGVTSVAIGYLHAYANGAHEQRTADILAAARPDLSITLASQVAPEIREYERLSTAVANAYVRPLMERYLRRLDGELRRRGFVCPFYLMTSGGGLATLDTAARFPIRLVESGPAGGAVLAASVARECDLPELLSFDMGGTTAKICMIDGYTPLTSRTFEVDRTYRFKKGSGLPVRIPVIEMVEIGAGGGSIARVDKLGRLQVGPESAGSEPGPVAYGRGGTAPTVTDADVALGKIVPDRFAGGRMPLDADAARAAVGQAVGTPLGLEGIAAPFGLAEVVDENMASAARAHAVEWGRDIASRAMVAFGGAAPLHAARLAEKLGIRTVVVPIDAGVGSAVGFLLAPAAYEVVRSRPMALEAFDAAAVNALYAAMRDEASGVVRGAAGDAALTETRQAFMRYRGQGHEIAVAVPFDRADAGAAEALARGFEAAYEGLYGRTIPGMGIEILTWTLTLSGPRPPARTAPRVEGRPAPPAGARHRVFDPPRAEEHDYAVYDRSTLAPGETIRGPALIVEDQTTTVVTSLFDATVNGLGYLILTRTEGGR
ncbi:MAG: hydantoinase/oxoprolinase family protein [Alphaproteobacteria bacterium]